jgi:hypothetical protein
MKKHLPIILSVVLASMTAPMLAHAGKKHGVPHQLKRILNEIQSLHGDIFSLASVSGAQQTEGLLLNPASGTTHDLVSLSGSGSFVAARMTKQGGNTDITTVELIVDGETVVGRTYAALDNWGMTQSNPFGVVLLHGNGVDAVTIGFPQPIKYNYSLVLRTKVNESGVDQMIGTVIHGE